MNGHLSILDIYSTSIRDVYVMCAQILQRFENDVCMLVTQICTLCLSYKVDKNSFTFAILFSLTTFKQPIENNTKDTQKVGLTHN